jgi:hypothetical protein
MSLKTADTFINTFSKGIVDLNYYKAQGNEDVRTLGHNYQKHKNLFNNLFAALLKRKKFVIDQDLWKELYLQSIYFYKYTDNINGIPLCLVTKHNQIIPFYMKNQIHKTNSTLLHFDTHSDEAPVKHSVLLPQLYQKYLETNNTFNEDVVRRQGTKYIDQAQELVWDIGAANSGILFTTGIRDVIWALPSWVPDTQLTIDIALKHGSKNISLITDTDISKITNLDELTPVKKIPSKYVKKTYTKVQTGQLTKHNINVLIDKIKQNGNKYILDIDLDYFVCNGKPFNNTYWKETFDLSSYHRISLQEINPSTPRYNSDNTKYLENYTKKISYEIKLIDKRIKIFFKTLFYLKKRGFLPEYISICDSTNVLFSECNFGKMCNSVSNNYVPMNLALYVHEKIIKGITKLTAHQTVS